MSASASLNQPDRLPLTTKNSRLAVKRREAHQELGFQAETKNAQLDNLSKIFATHLEATTATISIYTEDTICIKSSFGLAEDLPRQYPLGQSLGLFATASEHPEMVAVPDVLLDARYAHAAGKTDEANMSTSWLC